MTLVRKKLLLFALAQKEGNFQVSFSRTIMHFSSVSNLFCCSDSFHQYHTNLFCLLSWFWNQFPTGELNEHAQTQRGTYKVPTWAISVETDLCFWTWWYPEIRKRNKYLNVRNHWITSGDLLALPLSALTLWKKMQNIFDSLPSKIQISPSLGCCRGKTVWEPFFYVHILQFV